MIGEFIYGVLKSNELEPHRVSATRNTIKMTIGHPSLQTMTKKQPSQFGHFIISEVMTRHVLTEPTATSAEERLICPQTKDVLQPPYRLKLSQLA